MKSRTSMQDIADHLGISKNAVSLALNEKAGISDEMRAKIITAANKLNYQHGKRNKKKYNNLLILIPDYIRHDKYFYYDIFGAIQKRAKELGYQAIVSAVTKAMEEEMTLPGLLQEMSFQGMILIGVLPHDYVKILTEAGLPLVTVDHVYESMLLDSVVTANEEESRRLVRYLIELGHRNIGFIGAIGMTKSFEERWYGYRRAMSDAGLPVDPDNCIIDSSPLEVLHSSPEELMACLSRIERMPTAWFCANDRIAIALIQLLSAKGYQIPSDVSVAGFDDIDAAAMISPPLTTIQVQREQMGFEAVDFLIRKIEYGGSPMKYLIYGEMIVRQSCAPVCF